MAKADIVDDPAINVEQIWPKNKEPNLDLICKLGDRINTQLVLMIDLDVQYEQFQHAIHVDKLKHLKIYLIDLNECKMFSKENIEKFRLYQHTGIYDQLKIFDSMLREVINNYEAFINKNSMG